MHSSSIRQHRLHQASATATVPLTTSCQGGDVIAPADNSSNIRPVRARWLMRVRQSRNDSPWIIAMVAFVGVTLIVFVIASALIDLFDNQTSSLNSSNNHHLSLNKFIERNEIDKTPKTLVSLKNASFYSVCVAMTPHLDDCPNFSPHLDEVETAIALSDAGSLGPFVTRHVRQMMDDATQQRASIRLKKVSCAQLPFTENNHLEQAFCAISLQIGAIPLPVTTTTIDWSNQQDQQDFNDDAPSSNNRFIYTTLLDVVTLQPVEASGRLLSLPELVSSRLYPAHPTVFTFNNEPYISLLSIDSATDLVHHPYLWDVNRSIRVEIRLPAFVTKNWRHFAPTWVPWVIGRRDQRLYFIYTILPWQTVSCSFVTSRSHHGKQDDRYLLCKLESQTAPVLPKSFTLGSEEFRVRDTSLFLPFKEDYHLGYIQLVKQANLSAVSGHVMLINEQTRKIVALSSAVTPSGGDETLKRTSRKLAGKMAAGSFLLFGGMSGRRGVTIRIDGIGEILDVAISRDKQYQRTCSLPDINQHNNVKPFETNLLMQCENSYNNNSSIRIITNKANGNNNTNIITSVINYY